MAQVTCSRCFALFEIEETTPGAAPLCPACAPRAAASAAPPERPRATSARRRPGARRSGARLRAAVIGAMAVLAIAAAAAGGVALWRQRAAPEAPPPGVLEARLDEWRGAGLLPRTMRDGIRSAALADAGAAALRADLPQQTAAALEAYRGALAWAPGEGEAALAAAAGYATAFAEGAGEAADGAALRDAHDLVRDALAVRETPALLAARARLLLAVPSAANAAEALQLAQRAAAAAPADSGARLALGLARLHDDPAAAARELEEAAAAAPGDRRLLTAAARARWAAGDAPGALALAERRRTVDLAHAGALALEADVLAASDRIEEARAVLARWRAAAPESPLPPLLLARLAYQRDDDLGTARRLLDEALARASDDFVAARVLAHRAALELAAGDAVAAERAVAEALRRVPASAPARFQAALLAFRRGDARGLRESAGVVGDRAGKLAELSLAARSTELSGTSEEALDAWRAVADASPRDPAVLLGVAGALARIRQDGAALEVARRALARDPAEGRLRRAPTDFWEGNGALAEAARRLEAIGQAEARGGVEAFGAAAACELLMGRTVQAERLARAAALASPQAAAPQVVLAQVALDRADPRRAAPVARALVDAHPGAALALVVDARVQEALGKNQLAEVRHREAAEAGTDLITPRLALARLLARRGDAAPARALAQALLAEDPGLAEARAILLALAPPPAALSR